MGKKVKNSHVYIAESILKRFSSTNPKNGKKIVYYIDFSSNTIIQKSPGTFNTEKYYYTDDNETKLSNYAESRIGKVISDLEYKYNKYGLNIKITNGEILALKKYVGYQMIRTDPIIEDIKNTMNTKNNFPYSSQQYIEQVMRIKMFSISEVKIKNMFISIENEKNTFFSALKDLGIIIIFNKTNIPFLLNNNPYSINVNSSKYFLMDYTISPKIAISLCNKDSLNNALSVNNGVYITEYLDEKIVKSYNDSAYKTAKNHKPNILVGDYNELTRVMNN